MHGLHPVRPRAPSFPIIPKAYGASKEAAAALWAALFFVVLAALPVFSPDVWWHLSSGRWIWENGRPPDADPFSFTRLGDPWLDFEWAFQALLYPLGRSGDRALWLIKAALLALAYSPVDGLLRDRKAGPLVRVVGLALWSAAMLPKADLRPDLVSAALFAVLLRRLENGRASFLFGYLLFAAWVNLHGGFLVGLALYPLWALGSRLSGRERPEALWAELWGALFGALLNPYGLALAGVFTAHAADPVRAMISEWGPYSLKYPFHWPGFAAMLAAVWACGLALRREPAALPALAFLGASLVSARFTSYWPAAGVPLAAALLAPRAALPALAVLAALLAAATRSVDWGRAYQDSYVARRAVDRAVADKAALGPLRLFNMYEWGGYLGWRLGPGGLVFGDGRYLFHDHVPALNQALSSPEAMAAFVERERLGALLLRRFPDRVRGVRKYSDGTTKEMTRPWYVSLLPRERWALVDWDEQSLLFVDRRRAPKDWLKAREYRWWRADDGEAVADALSRGEAKSAVVDAERARWEAEHAR